MFKQYLNIDEDDYSLYEEKVKLDNSSNNIHAYANKIEFVYDETLEDDEIIIKVYYQLKL